MSNIRRQALSVPNIITYFRLALIPVFICVYFRGWYKTALGVLILSGLSDTADGFIARRFGMVTDLGKVIDPVADKLTQAVMLFCVAWRVKGLWAVLALLAVKELAMLLWGLYTLRLTGTVNGAKWYGKVCTWILYVSMAAMVLFPDMPAAYSHAITLLCAAALVMSLVLYSRWYIRFLRGCRGVSGVARPSQHEMFRAGRSVRIWCIVGGVTLLCAVLLAVYGRL